MISTDTEDMASVQYVRETLLSELPHCSYILLSHIFRMSHHVFDMKACSLISISTDLLHEVSLRAKKNRMDASNLAICVAPTLVCSKSIIVDLEICKVTTASSMSTSGSQSNIQRPTSTSSNTLGNIIVLCIQRYYEIFDELPDRTEARPISNASGQRSDSASRHSSSPSDLSSNKRDSSFFNDEDDIDDAMLVMPLGPNASGSRVPSSPPSAWAPGAGPSAAKYKPRHRTAKSKDSQDFNGQATTVRSMHTMGVATNGGGYASPSGRAKSTISIEKGGVPGTSRRGSIAIGRGTTRKGSGSAVETIGVTANGFFTAPASAPPVPSPSPRK